MSLGQSAKPSTLLARKRLPAPQTQLRGDEDAYLATAAASGAQQCSLFFQWSHSDLESQAVCGKLKDIQTGNHFGIHCPYYREIVGWFFKKKKTVMYDVLSFTCVSLQRSAILKLFFIFLLLLIQEKKVA